MSPFLGLGSGPLDDSHKNFSTGIYMEQETKKQRKCLLLQSIDFVYNKMDSGLAPNQMRSFDRLGPSLGLSFYWEYTALLSHLWGRFGFRVQNPCLNQTQIGALVSYWACTEAEMVLSQNLAC